MSDGGIDLGGLLGTVIVGGVAVKMTQSMFGNNKEHEGGERKERKEKRKANSNGYTRQNYVFGNNRNSPW